MNSFSVNYKEVILDEIALEGLDGIGLQSLWNRLGYRLNCVIDEYVKPRFWNHILTLNDVTFYALPVPAPVVVVTDRFSFTDMETGYLLEPDSYPDGPYQYCPATNDMGSCEHYNTRKEIPKDLLSSYEEVWKEFGDTIVIVASLEARWHSLASHVCITCLDQLLSTTFCFLELIGRARENGQVTIGKTNLSKIIKDPKMIFYQRKKLRDLGLISTLNVYQVTGGKFSKAILVTLKRFEKNRFTALPASGPMRTLAMYLREQPHEMESVAELHKKLGVTKKFLNRLCKGKNMGCLFKLVKEHELHDKGIMTNVPEKGRIMDPKYLKIAQSDSSSSSEDEEQTDTTKCDYKLGVSIVRQAYLALLESGTEGMSQKELTEKLGLDFYTGRMLCRHFMSLKIVKEFYQHKGRQRINRYVALAAAADVSKRYQQEKQRYMEYLQSARRQIANNKSVVDESIEIDVPSANATASVEIEVVSLNEGEASELSMETDTNTDIEIEVPAASETCLPNQMIPEEKAIITEIKEFKNVDKKEKGGFVGQTKTTSLKQLQFANCVIKIVRERLIVQGIKFLGFLVGEELGETINDNKSIKRVLSKLIYDKQIKVYSIRWGQSSMCTIVFCSPNITQDDPLINTVCNELCVKAYRSKKACEILNKDITFKEYCYPKFVRVRKMHEFLFSLVYLENEKPLCTPPFPQGCASLISIIPEMTVDLATGHVLARGFVELAQMRKDPKLLATKLKDAPPHVCKILLRTEKMLYAVRRSIMMLATMGLVQLCSTQNNTDSNFYYVNRLVFHVNKNAKFIDTSGAWPSREEKTLYRFKFETMNDIENYWNAVNQIALDTKVNSERNKNSPIVPTSTIESLKAKDNGDNVLGDKLGPCGFDSSFYMDIPRYWAFADGHKVAIKRKLKRVGGVIPRKKSRVQKPAKLKPKTAQRRPRKFIKAKVINNNKMKTITVKSKHVHWLDIEDRILVMCRVAKTIMSPTNVVGALQIANLATRHIISSMGIEKTTGVCHSRALTLQNSLNVVHERERLISEISKRPNLIRKFDSLLRKMRLKVPGHIHKFIKEGTTRMMELVWHMLQISNTSPAHLVPKFANDLNDLYLRVSIKRIKQYEQMSSPYLVQHPDAKEIDTLKEGIMQCLNSISGVDFGLETSKKIYDTFKTFPEVNIRTALQELRKAGAVAKREKNSSQFHEDSPLDVVQYSSVYKISVAYRRRYINRLCLEWIGEVFEQLKGAKPGEALVGSPELCCVLLETLTKNITTLTMLKKMSLSWDSENSNKFFYDITESEVQNAVLKRGEVAFSIVDERYQCLYDIYKDASDEPSMEFLKRRAQCLKPTQTKLEPELEKILQFVSDKKDDGATLQELETHLRTDLKTLQRQLEELETQHLIKKVGNLEYKLVAHEHLAPYTLMMNGIRILPAPWVSLNGNMNMTSLVPWLGTVLNTVFENPGSSVNFIAESIGCIVPRCVEDICVALMLQKIVEIKAVIFDEPDLFSDENPEIVLVDNYAYRDPGNIYVFPVTDALVKFSALRAKWQAERRFEDWRKGVTFFSSTYGKATIENFRKFASGVEKVCLDSPSTSGASDK